MQRRRFLAWCASALLALIPGGRLAADGAPLTRVNARAQALVRANKRAAQKQDDCPCEYDICRAENPLCAGDACATDFSCTNDASGDCTRDHCAKDTSAACAIDICRIDSSDACEGRDVCGVDRAPAGAAKTSAGASGVGDALSKLYADFVSG